MTRQGRRWFALPTLLFILALGLTIYNFQQQLPMAEWLTVLHHVNIKSPEQTVFYYSLLPRWVMSLLVGAGLGLAGLLFQQVLRNPLADPATLGLASGAQLAITVVTLWELPGDWLTQQMAAMMGALLVGAVVFCIAWSKRFSPITLILAGLVMSFYCGAVNQLFALFNHDQLQNMFLWGTGSLNQLDWRNVQALWPHLLVGLTLALLLLRPLTLIGLDDGVAKNLGLALSLTRLCTLGLATVLSAQLVSMVGIVGFIGLFSPLLARLLGARNLVSLMLLAPVIGALLLWLADQAVIVLSRLWVELSTGSVTALIGAPCLLWLLPSLRDHSISPVMCHGNPLSAERDNTMGWGLVSICLLVLLIVVALSLGRDNSGWVWASGEIWQQLLPWRAPRIVAALMAGMILAVAGCLMQRLTGNPMASPEVLGISSGAAFGIVIMLFIAPVEAFGWLLPAGSMGAAITLILIMLAARHSGFSSQRLLLAGMALSSVFSALLMLSLASGDPHMAGILTWISGSTYQVNGGQAWCLSAIALVLMTLIPLVSRWLNILPLGDTTARAVGMALIPSRLMLLVLAAALTAAATLTLGPLSFIGLLAPHMARMLGFRRTIPQISMAAMLGAGVMVFADWCGRMIAFPHQIPAGLLSTVLGAPYFIYLLRRT